MSILGPLPEETGIAVIAVQQIARASLSPAPAAGEAGADALPNTGRTFPRAKTALTAIAREVTGYPAISGRGWLGIAERAAATPKVCSSPPDPSAAGRSEWSDASSRQM